MKGPWKLGPGDPVPPFECASPLFPVWSIQSAAGVPSVLTYVGTAGVPAVVATLEAIRKRTDVFDGVRAVHYTTSCDPQDEARLREQIPGFRVLWDFDRKVARLLGVLEERADAPPRLHAVSFVLDRNLRVLRVVPIEDPARHAEVLAEVLESLPLDVPVPAPLGLAPVLVFPRLLEAELCTELVQFFESSAHAPTGVVMHTAEGPAKLVVDPHLKRRRDVPLPDGALREAIHHRIHRRLLPELRKAFQFRAAHIERYVVARYDAEDKGFFREHRDDQGKLTAHRQFACSINLNVDYEGGDVWFPEYGAHRYRAPQGGVLVFSCSLMHAVDPVTRGQRWCVLPFLYDDRGEAIRKKNLPKKKDARPR